MANIIKLDDSDDDDIDPEFVYLVDATKRVLNHYRDRDDSEGYAATEEIGRRLLRDNPAEVQKYLKNKSN